MRIVKIGVTATEYLSMKNNIHQNYMTMVSRKEKKNSITSRDKSSFLCIMLMEGPKSDVSDMSPQSRAVRYKQCRLVVTVMMWDARISGLWVSTRKCLNSPWSFDDQVYPFMDAVHSHSAGDAQHDNAVCDKAHIIEGFKKITVIFHFSLPFWLFFFLDVMKITVHKYIVQLFAAIALHRISKQL